MSGLLNMADRPEGTWSDQSHLLTHKSTTFTLNDVVSVNGGGTAVQSCFRVEDGCPSIHVNLARQLI